MSSHYSRQSRRCHMLIWLVLVGLSVAAGRTVAAPEVSVSIAPIHSLVAGVMQGAAMPRLLFQGGRSPHNQALSPSQLSQLAASDLIVWVGPVLTSSLRRTLDRLQTKAKVVALLELPAMQIMSLRKSGIWQQHEHDDATPEIDPHLWLSSHNARKIVTSIAVILSQMDPANAAQYKANANSMSGAIEQLRAQLMARLKPVREQPYLVFHDAYQYFETDFGLNPVASITLSAEHIPGAKRLSQLRGLLLEKQIVCVFAEPQFRPAAIRTLIEGTQVRYGELDPLGISIPAGPQHWFVLMHRLQQSLLGCLGRSPSASTR